MIPKHFEISFPWIVKPISNVKVSSNNTVWLERQIIRAIFTSEKTQNFEQDDYRIKLTNSLKAECPDEGKQVDYIKAVAQCLADAVIETSLPTSTQEWLKDLSKLSRKLARRLKVGPKENLPSKWNNLFSLSIELLNDSQLNKTPKKLELENALRLANRTGVISKEEAGTHGMLDLVAVLNLLSTQSKDLAEKTAIDVYRYPQTFFKEISSDKTLYLDYRRQAIRVIALLNQEYFNKTFDALTSYILSCLFKQEISQQSVKKIRENLNSKSD